MRRCTRKSTNQTLSTARGRDDTFIRIATHAIYDLNINILTAHEWMGDIRKADYTAYFFASSQAMFMQKWVSDGMPYSPHELAKLYEEMTRQFWISTFAPSTKA